MKNTHADLLQEIVSGGYIMTKEIESKLHTVAESFTSGYSI
jgi:F-type H+-transporting ATPase subunit alpha